MESLEDVRILVIERDKSVQRRLRKVFPEVAFTFVGDAKAAVARLESSPPEVVVMDLELPSLDGFQVLRVLKRKSLEHLPVVLLSADDSARHPDDSNVVAREDVSVLPALVRRLMMEHELRRSFSEAYARTLTDASRGEAELTADQRKVLGSAGFPFNKSVQAAPLAARAAKYDAIVASSLTTEAAAKRLRVNPSRVRQRLLATPRQLYGIRRNNAWLLPSFQFGKHGLVHGIDQVIARLDQALDLVAVETWFQTPNLDLEAGDEIRSPLEWLSEGRAVDPVVELAETL